MSTKKVIAVREMKGYQIIVANSTMYVHCKVDKKYPDTFTQKCNKLHISPTQQKSFETTKAYTRRMINLLKSRTKSVRETLTNEKIMNILKTQKHIMHKISITNKSINNVERYMKTPNSTNVDIMKIIQCIKSIDALENLIYSKCNNLIVYQINHIIIGFDLNYTFGDIILGETFGVSEDNSVLTLPFEDLQTIVTIAEEYDIDMSNFHKMLDEAV